MYSTVIVGCSTSSSMRPALWPAASCSLEILPDRLGREAARHQPDSERQRNRTEEGDRDRTNRLQRLAQSEKLGCESAEERANSAEQRIARSDPTTAHHQPGQQTADAPDQY